MFQSAHESREFGFLTQVLEMRIDPEERPAGEAGVHAAFEPRHRLVGVTEDRIHAGDLVVGVVRVAEGTRQIERPAHTLERRRRSDGDARAACLEGW